MLGGRNINAYRNEWKYLLTNQQMSLLKSRVSQVLELDPHTPPNGRYLIHSLYFDDYKNTRDFNYIELEDNVDYDVFGDGSIICFDTRGHTRGHQSVLVTLPNSGKIVIAADAASLPENLDLMVPPGRAIYSTERGLLAIEKLRKLRDEGALVMMGHCPVQWKELKKYANDNGISMIGDIPIYVSQDSSDVWEAPDQFLVDERCRPTRVAGVPPDYFSVDGQLWGNPLYDWDKMKTDGYKWWRDRISFMCEFFDCIRIDHFRGLEAFYTCAPDAKNARDGEWVKGPGREFVEILKKTCNGKQLIAEDLGIITPEVKELVEGSGLPGMKVLQFGFADDEDNAHLPHNYEKNCIAYTGTHDNNTLLGFMFDLDNETRNRLLSYCGFAGGWWDCRDAYYSVIKTMLESHADTVIFPLQDLLLYGGDTRMNTPGIDKGNWAWRVTKDQFLSLDRAYLKYLNELYKRTEE